MSDERYWLSMDRLKTAMQRAEDRMVRELAEAIFGTAPEERVRLLRESILGPQPGRPVTGLAAALSGPGFRER